MHLNILFLHRYSRLAPRFDNTIARARLAVGEIDHPGSRSSPRNMPVSRDQGGARIIASGVVFLTECRDLRNAMKPESKSIWRVRKFLTGNHLDKWPRIDAIHFSPAMIWSVWLGRWQVRSLARRKQVFLPFHVRVSVSATP
jgi:hypothetical protein